MVADLPGQTLRIRKLTDFEFPDFRAGGQGSGTVSSFQMRKGQFRVKNRIVRVRGKQRQEHFGWHSGGSDLPRRPERRRGQRSSANPLPDDLPGQPVVDQIDIIEDQCDDPHTVQFRGIPSPWGIHVGCTRSN